MLILFGHVESGGFGEEREVAGIDAVALCTCDLLGMKSVSSTAFTESSHACQGTTASPEWAHETEETGGILCAGWAELSHHASAHHCKSAGDRTLLGFILKC